MAATAHGAGLAEQPIDTLLIPRAPNNDADAAALDGMLWWWRTAVARGLPVEVAVLEPSIDRPALAERGLPADVAREPADWPALRALCARSRRVASLRLHGAVAGLEAGCVRQGLVQPKTRMMFDELGLLDWFSPIWNDLEPGFGHDDGGFAAALAGGFAAMRARLEPALAVVGTALGVALD